MGTKVSLEISKGGKVVNTEVVTARKTILGRVSSDDGARIVLDDETVSSDHAQLQLRGDDVLIQDLKSRNRVLVNGQFINPGVFYRLRHNDVIEICAYKLTVRLREPRKAPPLEAVPPSLGPFRCKVFYAPASVEAHDFYSFQSLPKDLAGVAVGTVGRALEISEETVGECGELLRIAAAETASPGAVLEKLNGVVLADLATENPISAVYGVLDPAGSTFRFASAGDIVPIFFNKARPTVLRKIPSDGKPLNVSKDPLGLVEKLVRFKPGDTLLLVTAGLLESAYLPDHQETQKLRNLVREELIDAWGDKLNTFLDRLKGRLSEVDGQVGPFGMTGLGRVVAAAGPKGVEALIPALEEAMKAHLRGQTPTLDQTVFAVERTG